MERQALNVFRMRLLGAEVRAFLFTGSLLALLDSDVVGRRTRVHLCVHARQSSPCTGLLRNAGPKTYTCLEASSSDAPSMLWCILEGWT